MDSLKQYLIEFENVLRQTPLQNVSIVISRLYEAWGHRKNIFILGNGGSAATASHMANDLSKATIVPGKPRIRVIALTDCIPLITAWANDTSYDNIFREQLENLLNQGDVVIGISASGNSRNVLRAMEFARENGAVTIGLTGVSGGELRPIVDHCVCIQTANIGIIEGIHMILDHLIANELLMKIRDNNEPKSNVYE